MKDWSERIEYLAERQSRAELDARDVAELVELCRDPAAARAFVEALADHHEWREWAGRAISSEKFVEAVVLRSSRDSTGEAFVKKVTERAGQRPAPRMVTRPQRSQGAPRSGLRYCKPVAAAAIVLIILGGAFVFFGERKPPGVAIVDHVQGEVLLLPDRSTLAGGQGVFSGQGLETAGAGTMAILLYPDGTRLEVGADSVLEKVDEGEAGKRVSLAKGTLRVNVARQSAGRSMLFDTPHGQVKVLGTTLRIAVAPDKLKGSTRLEVEGGKVQLRNLAGNTVDVPSGHYAVAAVGVELVAKPSIPKSAPKKTPRGAELIRNMQPRTWLSVPDSHLRTVVPDPVPPGVNGPVSIVDSSSGAAYDAPRDRLLVWGGGHSNYGGNEIYAFDLNTLAWSRIWGPSPNIPEPDRISAAAETYSDGAPVARHSYGGLEYLPTQDVLWCGGGGRYSSGNATPATWTFDPKEARWHRKADAPKTGYGNVAAYDPVTKHIFLYAQTDLLEYDPVSDVWISRFSGEWRSDFLSGAIDPARRKFVLVGGGVAYAFDLKPSGPITRSDLSTAGAKEMETVRSPGFAYDPKSDKFVAWSGGADVYLLDPATWAWTKVAAAAANRVVPPAACPRGTFGRFRYIPSRDAFVVVNSIDEDVFIYKPR